MARALIVGCGCRGRELGADLVSAQWAVRGTTRRADRTVPIADAGIEAVVANPDLVFDLLEHLDGVTMIFWLLGSAQGERRLLSAIHGPRLERVLEEIVDTPVRGFVYEAGGTVDESILDRGASIVARASQRWRIPAEIVRADPAEHAFWRAEMLASVVRLIEAR